MKKRRKWQSLRDAARDQSCVHCGAEDGTVVLAHCNMPGDFGTSLKGPDWWGAHLCVGCYAYADGDGRRDYLFWRQVIYKTQKRLFAQGFLQVKGG